MFDKPDGTLVPSDFDSCRRAGASPGSPWCFAKRMLRVGTTQTQPPQPSEQNDLDASTDLADVAFRYFQRMSTSFRRWVAHTPRQPWRMSMSTWIKTASEPPYLVVKMFGIHSTVPVTYFVCPPWGETN